MARKKNITNAGGICKTHAEMRHQQWQKDNPDKKLVAGDFVKMAFTDNNEIPTVEHMWVKIKGPYSKGKYIGSLDSHPAELKNWKYGQDVVFEYEEISDYLAEV